MGGEKGVREDSEGFHMSHGAGNVRGDMIAQGNEFKERSCEVWGNGGHTFYRGCVPFKGDVQRTVSWAIGLQLRTQVGAGDRHLGVGDILGPSTTV